MRAFISSSSLLILVGLVTQTADAFLSSVRPLRPAAHRGVAAPRMVLDDVSSVMVAALELGQNQNPTVFDPTTGKEVSENFNNEFGIAQAFEWIVGIGAYAAYKAGAFEGNEKFQAYMDRGLKPGIKSGVSVGREIADARRAALKAEKEAAKKAAGSRSRR
jgi:hypothetical protein